MSTMSPATTTTTLAKTSWLASPCCCCCCSWSKRLPTFHLRQIWLASQSFLFTYYLQTLLRLQTKSQASQQRAPTYAIFAPTTPPSAYHSYGYPCGPMANYKLFTSVYEFRYFLSFSLSAHFSPSLSLSLPAGKPRKCFDIYSCINRALNIALSTACVNLSTQLYTLTFSSFHGQALRWLVDRDVTSISKKRQLQNSRETIEKQI